MRQTKEPLKLEVEEAVRRGQKLPYAYIRRLSTVSLGKTPEAFSMDELIEARWFSETEEIRVFRREDHWQAAVLSVETGDHVLTETYDLQNSEVFGKTVTVHRFLEPDEDGQTNITFTCLAGWRGGETDG